MCERFGMMYRGEHAAGETHGDQRQDHSSETKSGGEQYGSRE